MTGYKTPPEHSRFRPGKSGNPGGRPKRPRPLATELLAELARQTAPPPGENESITVQTAIVRTLLKAAVGGDMRAIGIVLELHKAADAAVPPDEDDGRDAAAFETAVMREVQTRLATKGVKA